MKTLYKYIFLLFGLLSFYSCSEEEVETFSSERGINFRTDFTAPEINFYPLYVEKGMELSEVKIETFVQLEGTLSDQSTSVFLATQPFEDFEQPEFILPGDSAIEAGKYARKITIGCMKPKEYNKIYKANLTFDYEQSHLVPGILEQQTRLVTVYDKTIWGDMGVENEEKWNEAFSSMLGKYGEVKARFILAALGKKGLNYKQIKYKYQNTMWYPDYGLAPLLGDLKKSLEEYNTSHDTVLCEADGTPVSFN